MGFLVAQSLAKTYDDGTEAVRGIDLDVAEGQFVVLLGPSGCGKTTTLRMVAGLEIPTRGTISLGGTDVTTLRPAQRDVGFVFQFYALYPHLRVRENIGFPLRAMGVPRRESATRVEAVAARLQITELLDRLPRQLSGGDQQRVALARAMVRQPSIYLMDEPLGTLDHGLRMEMRELLRAQQLETRVTTLYVTHDQEEAMSLADLVVVMSGGKILQMGSPRQVYDDPNCLFVARFVGSPGMNFLRGAPAAGERFAPSGEGSEELTLPLPGRRAGELVGELAGELVLGVRPEHVLVDAHGALPGTVVVDEFLGSHRYLYVDTPAGRLVARTPASCPHRAGESLRLTLDPAYTCLFDAHTEARL